MGNLAALLMVGLLSFCPGGIEVSNPSTAALPPSAGVYAEQTRWYHRMVDGKMQRRLWSLTYNKWLTDWIDME